MEKEAAIAENETKAKIRLEEERAELLARERDNELSLARTASETAQIAADGAAGTRRVAAQAEAEAILTLDDARLKGERERAEIAKTTPQVAVIADALKHVLDDANVGTLNLGPDVVSLITSVLRQAAERPAA